MRSAATLSAEVRLSGPCLCTRRNLMYRSKSRETALASTLLAVLVFALTGCASQSYLYSAEKDKQGQAVKKAANEAKLGEAIVATDKRNARLLDLEIEAAKARHAQIRELEIRAIAFPNKPLGSTWLARIDGRLIAIYGSGRFQDVVAAQNVLATEERKVQERRDALETLARPAPDCAVALMADQLPELLRKKIEVARLSEADHLYAQLRKACTPYDLARNNYTQVLGQADRTSLLAKALKQLNDDEDERMQVDLARQGASNALALAEKEFAEATKNLLPETTAYAETLVAAAKRLRERVEVIEEVQEGIAVDVIAKARLDRIEDILSAVAGGEVDTSKWNAHLRQSVALAGTLPALVDEASRMLRDAARPRLAPFELAKQHQRLVVDEAEMIRAVIENRVQVSKRIVEAYTAEASTLTRVRKTAEKLRGETLDSLIASTNAPRKQELYQALGKR